MALETLFIFDLEEKGRWGGVGWGGQYGDKSLAKLIQEKAPMWKGEKGGKEKRRRRPTSQKKETRSASLQTRTPPKENNNSIDSYFFVFASASFDMEDMQVGMRIMHYKTSLL